MPISGHVQPAPYATDLQQSLCYMATGKVSEVLVWTNKWQVICSPVPKSAIFSDIKFLPHVLVHMLLLFSVIFIISIIVPFFCVLQVSNWLYC